MQNTRPTNKYLEALAKAFAVFVLLFSSTGLLIPLLHQGTSTDVDMNQGDALTQLLWLGVYGVAFLLIVSRWRLFLSLATRNKLLLVLVGVVLASVLWSAAPDVTLRRGVALVGTTLFGAYLGARYGLGELLRLLAWTLGIVALLSLLVALALPSYGISSTSLTAGDWKGVFVHKNILGREMALSALVFFLIALDDRRYRRLAWGGFVLSFGLLLLSGSMTSLIVLATVLFLLPLYKALRWSHTASVPFLIAVVLLVGGTTQWILGDVQALLDTLGKDVTLTGRTLLWPAVVEMIEERPWLGYGYSAFWLGWEGESATLWFITNQEYDHAHNGILDLWLDLGLVGVCVFTAAYLLAFGRAVIWARATKTMEGLWPLAFLTFMMLYNLTESALLLRNNPIWILFVAVGVATTLRRGKPPERTA